MSLRGYGALRHRDFALLWVGQAVSRIGTEINFVAVSWQLYQLTHSPVKLGLLGLCRVLPVLVLALGAGVLADAVDRRRMMLATQTVLALSAATLALLTASGHVSAEAIYALTFATGCATAFDNPARQALLPALVPPGDLPGAIGLSVTTWQLASVVGPALGGVLLAVGGGSGHAADGLVLAYAVDAASFLAIIVALLVMRPPRAPAPLRVSFGAALEGLRFLRRTPIIIWMMALDFAATFFAGSLLLMPIFADQVLGVGKHGLGLLLSAPAAGALVAALVMSALPAPRARGRVILTAVTVYGFAIAAFGVSQSFGLSLALLAISGAADTVSMVIRQTIRQLLTPDELRGRMTSLNMIFFMGGPQLGEFEAGLVARAIGAPLSVTLGGVLCVLFTVSVATFVPAVRNHSAD